MKQLADEEVTGLAKELARLSNAKSRVFRMSFWNERLLNWALARPDFKAQLFRFVDVFPGTTSNKDVMRHVEEYLGGSSTPAALRGAIDFAGHVPFGANVTASQARRNIARMADQFILGTTTAEAVKGARELWNSGSVTTIDLLGEKTVAESEADVYATRVKELLEALAAETGKWKQNDFLDSDDLGPLPRASISVKPTALAPKYKALTREEGLEQAKARLRPILRASLGGRCLLFFDMEQYEVKDLTIELFMSLLDEDEFKDVDAGIVMQAYLRDTYTDLGKLIAWSAQRSKPIFVRLVKGAYWDTETVYAQQHGWLQPVFNEKVQSDANYERCARLLLDHHGEVRAAFASHNLRSLAYAISYARKKGLPNNAFEVQMLYGMAEPMHEAIRKYGLRLRVYAPVGELVPGMAYLVRRLLENTSNDSFVRMRFAEDKNLDQLLAPPHVDHIPDANPLAHRPETDAAAPTEYEPEPLLEWHRDGPRQVVEKAVADWSAKSTPENVPAIINGQRVSTKDKINSLNPSDPARVVARSSSCSADDVEPAMAAAKKAFTAWSKAAASQRASVLFRAAQWMRANKSELIAIEVVEAGKPWGDADGDVCEAIDFCEYYGREILRIDKGGKVQSPPGEANQLRYQPRGIGVVIAPWNFPLAIPTGMVTAALVTGNCVLFKPAEQTPLIASKLVEALEAGGLPKGVLQFLPGYGENVGAALVNHPDTAFIAFTGSRAVGLSIVEQAARQQPGQNHIKKVIAELGGKNPTIVDTDSDLDQAIPAIVYSAFGFAGQKCSALSRLIVLEQIADQVIERLIGAVNELTIGAPSAMGVDVGPVIDSDAHQRIKATIEGAFMWGDIAVSRTDVPTAGYFVPPTVVVDVKPESPLAKDEIFGPVLSVFRAKNLDHALELANDSPYALTAGVFSRSPSTIKRVSEEVRAGNVYINRQITGAVVGRQPFGGYGLSGVGSKAGGPDYLLQFMEPRAITENTMRQGFAELT
jgi:RHH-type transcriptional regulator, proline utilization regulon repressor / proline dehydrogenase / delta 1-pyrroline-5-carboxylate dehydrogenase